MKVTKKDIRSFFLLWLLYLLFVVCVMYPVMEKADFSQPFRYFLVGYVLFGGIINFPVFFLSYQFITPLYFKPGKYLLFVLYVVLLILAYYPVKLFFAGFFADVQIDYLRQENDTPQDVMAKYFFASSVISSFVIFLGFAGRRINDWFQHDRIKRELETEKLNAEIALLKMQVNPHFLFNTLNNIYALSLDNSKETPGAVLKLSHLMRYMLEESTAKHGLVCLQKEIDFIHDYLDLHRLRSDERFYPEFIYEGDFSNKKIAPLLLIPFIENAFKYGLTKDASHPIEIKTILNADTLELTVKNKKRKTFTHKPVSHGTGLENTRKRLQSLYPNKHQLLIQQDEDYYAVRLSVTLS